MERLRHLAARVTVLALPFDDNASHRRGLAVAPRRIRETLHSESMNLTAECGLDQGRNDQWVDAGDLSFSRTDGMVEKVQRAVDGILKLGGAVLALAGDHSITVPLVRRKPRRLTLPFPHPVAGTLRSPHLGAAVIAPIQGRFPNESPLNLCLSLTS